MEVHGRRRPKQAEPTLGRLSRLLPACAHGLLQCWVSSSLDSLLINAYPSVVVPWLVNADAPQVSPKKKRRYMKLVMRKLKAMKGEMIQKVRKNLCHLLLALDALLLARSVQVLYMPWAPPPLTRAPPMCRVEGPCSSIYGGCLGQWQWLWRTTSG